MREKLSVKFYYCQTTSWWVMTYSQRILFQLNLTHIISNIKLPMSHIRWNSALFFWFSISIQRHLRNEPLNALPISVPLNTLEYTIIILSVLIETGPAISFITLPTYHHHRISWVCMVLVRVYTKFLYMLECGYILKIIVLVLYLLLLHIYREQCSKIYSWSFITETFLIEFCMLCFYFCNTLLIYSNDELGTTIPALKRDDSRPPITRLWSHSI